MKKILKMKLYLLLSIFFSACEMNSSVSDKEKLSTANVNIKLIHEQGARLTERILTPEGYKRENESAHSFGAFLRNVSLKPHGSTVKLYNGSAKGNQSVHAAILDVTVGRYDLQQCADAVMRLRADYLMHEKRYDDIAFNFTNGFKASYSQWRRGKGIQVSNNRCSWINSAQANESAESYSLYLQKVFSYAGSLSLAQQLRAITDINDIQAGDVWIRGGSPGHAVIVMDVAKNKDGKKIFLIAQSYMPAQDIHILKNPLNASMSPWYAVDEIDADFATPEYTFDRSELKRW